MKKVMKSTIIISKETLNGMLRMLSNPQGVDIDPLINDLCFSANGDTEEVKMMKNLTKINATLLLNGIKASVPEHPLYERAGGGYYEVHVLHCSLLQGFYVAEVTFCQYDKEEHVFVAKYTNTRSYTFEEFEALEEDKAKVTTYFIKKSAE